MVSAWVRDIKLRPTQSSSYPRLLVKELILRLPHADDTFYCSSWWLDGEVDEKFKPFFGPNSQVSPDTDAYLLISG